MNLNMQRDNLPQWNKKSQGFYEVWYLKLNLPPANGKAGPALWLRFTTLSSRTGLKKVAETWAIFFDPLAPGGSQKLALKNTASPSAYSSQANGTIQIEDCTLGSGFTSGSVVSRGQRIEWDLRFEPNSHTFFHVPQVLQKLKLTKSIVCKPNISIQFKGHFKVNEKTYECDDTPGCQGHIWGQKHAQEWAWSHCNFFEGSDAVVEALTARVKFGEIVTSPRLSALYLQYKGERFEFNNLVDAFSIKSEYSLTSWKFSADKGSLRIQGEIACDVKDLVALTYEDTDGSFLYCNHSELASMNVSVYFKGKLDSSLRSLQTTGFETVSRKKSPYVEVLL
ncbi:MAG: tocopherol cyclase family protein [Bdellovibrionota bacterium]